MKKYEWLIWVVAGVAVLWVVSKVSTAASNVGGALNTAGSDVDAGEGGLDLLTYGIL